MMSLTVRLPDDVGKLLDGVASDQDRSKAYIAARAIENHVRYEAAFIAGVKRGLAAAERGEFATDEEVAAVFAKYESPKKGSE